MVERADVRRMMEAMEKAVREISRQIVVVALFLFPMPALADDPCAKLPVGSISRLECKHTQQRLDKAQRERNEEGGVVHAAARHADRRLAAHAPGQRAGQRRQPYWSGGHHA